MEQHQCIHGGASEGQSFFGKLVEHRRSTLCQQKLSVGRDSKILPKSKGKGDVPVAAPRTHFSVERVGQMDIAALFRKRDSGRDARRLTNTEKGHPRELGAHKSM